jgi:sugar transferase (PEP-CTERM/EpsH1 system associated)
MPERPNNLSDARARRRIVHVMYSFSVGGLENVIVQLINRLPSERFSHVVLSLTSISDFKDRVTQPDVKFIELHKPPGHAVPLYPRIYKLLREIKPDVVHTCNLAALEIVPVAWAAGISRRVHAEHGWDALDPAGRNLKYQRLRKLYRPFVSHYVAVSNDLSNYLANAVGVPEHRRSVIANGVDTQVFSPAESGTSRVVPGCPFDPQRHWLIGTVGRLQTVKNQPLLAKAFVRLVQENPGLAEQARLVMVGEGPLRAEVEAILGSAGLLHLAWLPGARTDVPAILRSFSCFVLPSETEGTSCTLQEAMACGLPVVCTAVGGTVDMVDHGVTGQLVPSGDETAMARALAHYMQNPDTAKQHGLAARSLAESTFGMDGMLARYAQLFDTP